MDTLFSSVNTHCMLYTGLWGLPVPKFLDVKSNLGPTDGPAGGPGWGGASEFYFLFFLPLPDVVLAS